MFSDTRLFLNFDKALKFFDDFSQYHQHFRDDLIFLVPAIEARRICESNDIDNGELLGVYKGIPIMCEQVSFRGLWVRDHDNVYYKFIEFPEFIEF